MNPLSCNTKLSNRILWFDGESSFEPTAVISSIKNGINVKFVTEITRDIELYNQLTTKPLLIKNDVSIPSIEWMISPEVARKDFLDILHNKHEIICRDKNIVEITQRERRLAEELIMYKRYSLYDLLFVLNHIVDTFTNNNVVWGIGRGSSVASYVLFVIGLHDVDSFLYDLDLNEFFHS